MEGLASCQGQVTVLLEVLGHGSPIRADPWLAEVVDEVEDLGAVLAGCHVSGLEVGQHLDQGNVCQHVWDASVLLASDLHACKQAMRADVREVRFTTSQALQRRGLGRQQQPNTTATTKHKNKNQSQQQLPNTSKHNNNVSDLS